MSENKASQPQQDAWNKTMGEGAARMEQAFGEVARFEAEGRESAFAAMDEILKLQKDTFAYYCQLAADWRKLSLESTRRATEFVTAKG